MSKYLSLFCLLLASCSTSTDSKVAAKEPSPELEELIEIEVDLEQWREERIELPPAFAPELPSGREVLRFAPGMFEAGAEDNWSYVFVAEFDGSRLGLAELDEFFELYYDGLCSGMAGKDPARWPEDPTNTELEAHGDGRFTGVVELIDIFVTGDSLTVNLDVEVEDTGMGSMMRVKASPQPRGHEIWRRLDIVLAAAVSSFDN